MGGPTVATKTVTADEARKNLSDLLSTATYANGRIEIQRRGKTAGFIIGPNDMALLEVLEDRYDAEEARAAMAEIERGEDEVILWEEAKKELNSTEETAEK